MSIRTKGLMFAMEEVGNEEEEAAMVPETAAEVEAASAEVAENVATIEDSEGAVDDAMGDTETLGQIQDVIAEKVESGEGLDESAAQIAEIAVEAICARLGMQNRMMPAMESFGSKNSRLAASKIALEGFGDSIKKVLKNVLEFLKNLWAKIVSFVTGLLSNRKMMQKHLDALKTRVEALTDQTFKEKKIKGGFVKQMSIGKAMVTATTAEKILECGVKALEAAKESTNTILKSAGALLASETETAVFPLTVTIKQNFASLGAALGEGLGNASNKNGHGKVDFYGNLVGGRAVEFADIAKTDKKAAVTTLTISVISKDFPEEAAALDKGEMLKLLKAAETTLEKLVEADKTAKTMDGVVKQCQKLGDAFAKNLDAKNADAKGEEKEAAKKGQELIERIREINSLASKLAATIPSFVFQSVKGGADYVSASLSNMKAKEDK